MSARRCWEVLIACGLVCVAVAGCSSASVDPVIARFQNDHADVSEATHTISLPLDHFEMSQTQVVEVEHANALLTDACMRKVGSFYPPASLVEWKAVAPVPDRRYGIWDETIAKRYGYGLPPSSVFDAANAKMRSLGKGWADKLASCQSPKNMLPVLRTDWADPTSEKVLSVSAEGETVSFQSAEANKAWSTARQDWWKCLRGHSVTPRTGPTDWVPKFPASQHAKQVQIALIDIRCKQKTHLISRLADLEDRYQLEFISLNAALLKKQSESVDKEMTRVSKILELGGGD